MPDFRVSDTAPEHRKMRAAGIAAIGLWTMAGAYSMGPTQMTDGWVPEYWVTGWPGGKKAAATLVKVGLWTSQERDGMPGFQFHEWAERQRMAVEWEEEKRKARERMERIRSGQKRPSTQVSARDVRANNGRTSNGTPDARSANVHDSLTLTHRESSGGGVTTAPARENPPPPRCPQHVHADGDPGPCRACGDARRAREAWDADTDRREAARRSAEAREAAELRARAVAACDLCDERGYQGRVLCDHDPDFEARAARGSAAARAAMAAGSARRRPESPQEDS